MFNVVIREINNSFAEVDVSSVDEAVTRLSQAANQWQKECSAGKKDIIATMKVISGLAESKVTNISVVSSRSGRGTREDSSG